MLLGHLTLRYLQQAKTLFTFRLGPNLRRELWRTDGTAEGTVLVADISPGSNSSIRSYYWSSSVASLQGDTLYFILYMILSAGLSKHYQILFNTDLPVISSEQARTLSHSVP